MCTLTWLDDDNLDPVLAQRLVAAQAPPAQPVLARPVHSLQTAPEGSTLCRGHTWLCLERRQHGAHDVN